MHMCSHTVAIEKIKPVKAARPRSFSKLKCIKTMREFFPFLAGMDLCTMQVVSKPYLFKPLLHQVLLVPP